MKIVRFFDWEPDFESNDLPSKTVPDMSLSVNEILVKYTSGTLGDEFREMEYSDDMPDLRFIEFEQLQSIREENVNLIKEIDDEIKSRQTSGSDVSDGVGDNVEPVEDGKKVSQNLQGE